MPDGNDLARWARVHRLATEAGNQEDADYALQQMNQLAQSANAVDVAEAKKIAPGWAFAQGAAEGASFGLGSLVGGKEVREFTREAGQQHPTAMLAGRVAGALTPLGAEKLAATAGARVLPLAASRLLRMPGLRQAADVAAAELNPLRVLRTPLVRTVAQGAGYGAGAGALQAAAEAEPGQRLEAAESGAKTGAVFGAVAPVALTGALATAGALRRSGRLLRGLAREGAGLPTVEREAAQARPAAIKPRSQSELLAYIQERGRTQGRPLTAESAVRSGRASPGSPMGPRPGTAARTPQSAGQLSGGSRDVIPSGQRGPVVPKTAVAETEVAELPTEPTTNPEIPAKGPTKAPGERLQKIHVGRPGESLEQIAPQGYAVHGMRATPAVSEQGPTLAELSGPGELPPLRRANTPTKLGDPMTRIVEAARGEPTPEALGQVAKDLRRASPMTRGHLRAWLQNPASEGIAPEWRAMLAREQVVPIRGKRPGHPVWEGPGSPTTSAEVRGGEPLLPNYTRGGRAEQQVAPLPASYGAPPDLGRIPTDQLRRMLLGPEAVPFARFAGAIRAELTNRLAAGATP